MCPPLTCIGSGGQSPLEGCPAEASQLGSGLWSQWEWGCLSNTCLGWWSTEGPPFPVVSCAATSRLPEPTGPALEDPLLSPSAPLLVPEVGQHCPLPVFQLVSPCLSPHRTAGGAGPHSCGAGNKDKWGRRRSWVLRLGLGLSGAVSWVWEALCTTLWVVLT